MYVQCVCFGFSKACLCVQVNNCSCASACGSVIQSFMTAMPFNGVWLIKYSDRGLGHAVLNPSRVDKLCCIKQYVVVASLWRPRDQCIGMKKQKCCEIVSSGSNDDLFLAIRVTYFLFSV